MKNRKNSQIGGQKTNETGTISTALALLYLQGKYPGTFVQANPSQVIGDSPYDIGQWESIDQGVWAIKVAAGLPASSWIQSSPLRLWEVKSIKKANKRFPIDLDNHRQLLRTKAFHGVSYLFVLFTAWDYSGEQLRCEYRMKEMSGKQVSRLLAKTRPWKLHRLARGLPRYLRKGKVAGWISYADIFEKVD